MSNKLKKRFFVGDEWLYYKLYCGNKISDTILTDIILPFTKKLTKKGYIDKWFFVRYNDPNYHIRLRIRLCNTKEIGFVINTFNRSIKNLLKSKSIWLVQIDCYDREIERYGIKTIELSEDIFWKDSIEILNFLSNNKSSEFKKTDFSKSIFGLKLIDFYLRSFELTNIEKVNFTKKIRDSFYEEFEITKENKKQIEIVYINNKEIINSELSFFIDPDLTTHLDLNLKEVLKETKGKISSDKFNYILSSYIHMSLNRLFYSNNRIHELVCYDVLWKFYKFKLYS